MKFYKLEVPTHNDKPWPVDGNTDCRCSPLSVTPTSVRRMDRRSVQGSSIVARRSVDVKEAVLKISVEAFSHRGDGVLRYQGRLYDPIFDDLREQILSKAHSSRYSIHPRAKMNRDLWEVYWRNRMKKDIEEFVTKCPNCQQVKVEHQ
ncbi:hypothetical protein MTR67_006770 [Solanum verrucosum]|uniref:Integrase zinc-binding domain-containing protein n=1 Tax=Solanum verrucosum TaxID=315347 RepID=A0AAF0Q0T4_SOLVR|nr:hypothetical protein MTR67_006770 [Solanum verrucosum]